MATTKFYFTIDKRGKRMLLFSTILEIDKKLTKNDFINLVIEWNQKGHPESIISDIE